jgi:hypothetical protein
MERYLDRMKKVTTPARYGEKKIPRTKNRTVWILLSAW